MSRSRIDVHQKQESADVEEWTNDNDERGMGDNQDEEVLADTRYNIDEG